MSEMPQASARPRLVDPPHPIFVSALANDVEPARSAIIVKHEKGAFVSVVEIVDGSVLRRFTFDPIGIGRFIRDAPILAPDLWSVRLQQSDPVPIEGEEARYLWSFLLERDSTLAKVGQTLPQLLDDTNRGLRDSDVSSIVRAVGIALEHERSLDGILLFATILATATSRETDSGRSVLDALSQQARTKQERDQAQFVLELLRLSERGIRSLAEPTKLSRTQILGSARPSQVMLVERILDAAEAIRAAVSPKNSVHTRHILAALLADRSGDSTADYLWAHNFDVDALRRSFLDYLARRHADEPFDEWRAALPITPFDVATRAITDVWTYDDGLGYGTYADVISVSILRGQTRPPLTIGIESPWGQGKTTLMKMIQRRLDPASKERQDKIAAPTRDESVVRSTYGELLEWLDPNDWLARFRAGTRNFTNRLKRLVGIKGTPPDPDDANGMLPEMAGAIPTVWFNPLYYQESSQIWAGMAHAILHQLSQQIIGQRRRELFWLRLQLARLNVPAIRRDIHRIVITRLLPIGAFFLSLIGLVITWLAFFPLSIIDIAAGSSSAVALIALAWRSFYEFLNARTIDRDYQTYVTEPDYESRLGLLHLVDQDLERALALLVGPQRPIAVFVDDLDRCDPDTVSRIVLAINQFLSLRTRNVFFFLGMDMDMVAGALERAHKDLPQPSTATRSNAYRRSFGWRFMEKFIQLPFVIPHLDADVARQYAMDQLRAPAGAPAETVQANPEVRPEITRIVEQIKRVPSATRLGTFAKAAIPENASPEERALVRREIVAQTSALMLDPQSAEMKRIIDLAIGDLELNPRAIKRYFGLVRILRTIQISAGGSADPDLDRKIVLRAAHLLMNWPQFVHWVREHQQLLDDDGVWKSSCALLGEKAAKNYADWSAALTTIIGKQPPAYLLDISLHRYLNKLANDAPGLNDLYEARMF